MLHLIYGTRIYLNVDKAQEIFIDNTFDVVVIRMNNSTDFRLDVCTHPRVKELLASTREEDQAVVKRQVCYKVLEVILERLANTDEKATPIINLEAGLNTLQKAAPEEIPVTVDKDGNITKVLKEEGNE